MGIGSKFWSVVACDFSEWDLVQGMLNSFGNEEEPQNHYEQAQEAGG